MSPRPDGWAFIVPRVDPPPKQTWRTRRPSRHGGKLQGPTQPLDPSVTGSWLSPPIQTNNSKEMDMSELVRRGDYLPSTSVVPVRRTTRYALERVRDAAL